MFKKRIYREGCCEWCAQEGPQQRKVPNHLIHFVLTVLTLGLWGVSWLSISIVLNGERWRCGRCGAPQRAEGEASGESGVEAQVALEAEPDGAQVRAEQPVSVIRTDRFQKVA